MTIWRHKIGLAPMSAEGFAEGSLKLMREQSVERSSFTKKHHEESQAADKLCAWRNDDASEKWRETARKAPGSLEHGC